MCQHFSDLDPEDSPFNCSLLYLLRDYNGDKEYGRKDSLFTRIVRIASAIYSAMQILNFRLYFLLLHLTF